MLFVIEKTLKLFVLPQKVFEEYICQRSCQFDEYIEFTYYGSTEGFLMGKNLKL